jgi:hypothetical protein
MSIGQPDYDRYSLEMQAEFFRNKRHALADDRLGKWSRAEDGWKQEQLQNERRQF